MSPQVIMSSEKVRNSPELCPVKGQKPNLGTQAGSRNWLWVCLGVPPRPRHHIQCWLTNRHPILLRISWLDSQGRLNVQHTLDESLPLRARRRSRFLVPQQVQRSPFVALYSLLGLIESGQESKCAFSNNRFTRQHEVVCPKTWDFTLRVRGKDQPLNSL